MRIELWMVSLAMCSERTPKVSVTYTEPASASERPRRHREKKPMGVVTVNELVKYDFQEF